MKQFDRVLLGMELKVVAPSLMWKEAVLVVQYSMVSFWLNKIVSKHATSRRLLFENPKFGHMK